MAFMFMDSPNIKTSEKVGAGLGLGAWAAALLMPGMIGEYGMGITALMAVGMCIMAKLAQWGRITADMGLGSLSLTTHLLMTAVGLARCGTEMLGSGGMSATPVALTVLNLCLLGSFLWFQKTANMKVKCDNHYREVERKVQSGEMERAKADMTKW